MSYVNRNIKIAKQLIKLAKNLIKDEQNLHDNIDKELKKIIIQEQEYTLFQQTSKNSNKWVSKPFNDKADLPFIYIILNKHINKICIYYDFPNDIEKHKRKVQKEKQQTIVGMLQELAKVKQEVQHYIINEKNQVLDKHNQEKRNNQDNDQDNDQEGENDQDLKELDELDELAEQEQKQEKE